MLQISEYQWTKANHNLPLGLSPKIEVVTNIRISMNESKSQPSWAMNVIPMCCYKYQNINERKQITTVITFPPIFQLLLQISEYQWTKANHNCLNKVLSTSRLLQISEYQWTKANHNFNAPATAGACCCYKYQNINERKQITTPLSEYILKVVLLQISEYQWTKANHNPISHEVRSI